MNEEHHPSRDALDDKVNRVFAGKVVRKDLVRKVKVGANVPVFVLEYLLGKYCASSDELAIQMGLQVVNDILAENYIGPDEATRVQSRVKEQGGRDLISADPLPPGTVYTESVSGDGTVGLYRVEVSTSTGTSKLKLTGGVKGMLKESIQRAFSYLLSNKGMLGVAREVDTSDFYVESIDLLGNGVEAEVGVAFLVACFSILRKSSPQPALLILGDTSIQGNIKPVRSLVEPLQVGMDSGAKRALIPIENKRNFFDVSADVLENVDPIFYGDLKTAAFKALGLN